MGDTPCVEEGLKPVHAGVGIGPLLQRDYTAVIEGTDAEPEHLIDLLCERFEEFAPAQTATFCKAKGTSGPLSSGCEMDIVIKLVGHCRVRVVHRDRLGLTLRTLEGHPEAGRITFAAGRDDRGDLTFQIRSRTRASGLGSYLGYLLLGKQMQSRTWIRFIWNLAEAAGGKVRDCVQVRTARVDERNADGEGVDAPTLASRGAG